MNGPAAQRLTPGNIALVIGSIVAALLALELGCRLLRGPGSLTDWHNLVLRDRVYTREMRIGRLQPDRALGFVNTPNYHTAQFTYDARGFRVAPNPEGVALAEPPLLVVGDSLAHGEEVNDAEAWPSLVQQSLRRRVLNAALTGYGLDQVVLRTEKIVTATRPAAIVLSLAADDVRRNEMKRMWGMEKPYFERVDGKLALRNVPVPPPPAPADTLDAWQWLFGWSVALDTFLRHKGWQYEWAVDHERVLPRGEGMALSCLLLRRLAALRLPTLVVAEYNRYVFENAEYGAETHATTRALLACAAEAGFSTLDTFDAVGAAVRQSGIDAVFRTSHPGPDGTRIAAQAIAAAIAQHGLLAR
jgi:lysophospholipase L1-like esterase